MSAGAAVAAAIAAALLVSASGAGAPARPPQILFARYANDGNRLYLADSSGRHVVRLTSGYWADEPAWAPDGLRIAYQSQPVSTDYDVLTIASLRGPLHRLESEKGEYNHPVWSPNGRMIAFKLVEDPDGPVPTANVGVVGADGKHQRLLDDYGVWDNRPTWAPDSKRIAFAAQDGIRVVSIGGGASRLVAPAQATFSDPAWSPRGRRIAFVSPEGLEVVAPDGSGHRLIARVRGAANPAWSPGGRTIAFDDSGRTQNSSVYEVYPDGKGLTRMTKPALGASFPAWSLDGKRIAFGGDAGLYVMRSNGAALVQITKADDQEPVWRPRR